MTDFRSLICMAKFLSFFLVGQKHSSYNTQSWMRSSLGMVFTGTKPCTPPPATSLDAPHNHQLPHGVASLAPTQPAHHRAPRCRLRPGGPTAVSTGLDHSEQSLLEWGERVFVAGDAPVATGTAPSCTVSFMLNPQENKNRVDLAGLSHCPSGLRNTNTCRAEKGQPGAPRPQERHLYQRMQPSHLAHSRNSSPSPLARCHPRVVLTGCQTLCLPHSNYAPLGVTHSSLFLNVHSPPPTPVFHSMMNTYS